MARYSGKQTGGASLSRRLPERLEAGNVLLTDAMFQNYWTIAKARLLKRARPYGNALRGCSVLPREAAKTLKIA